MGCTTEQLLIAIDGYIATDVLPLSKNAKTYYGFVSVFHMVCEQDFCYFAFSQTQETSLYKSEYDRLRQGEYSRFHGYAYDGIWAIALAIQSVNKKLRMKNLHLTIENFQYRDPFWAELFKEALNETSFDGVTVGCLSFTREYGALPSRFSVHFTMSNLEQSKWSCWHIKLTFSVNQSWSLDSDHSKWLVISSQLLVLHSLCREQACSKC